MGCIGVIPDTVNVMQGVDFVSCTKNANTYQWDFGDGNSAAADSVYHTYTTPGTYHGSLTTSNGQSSTKDFTIVVINNPAGYFTAGGITYFPGICDSTSQGVLSAITVLDSFVQQALTIGFAGGGLPTASGVYTVSDNDYVGTALARTGSIKFGSIRLTCILRIYRWKWHTESLRHSHAKRQTEYHRQQYRVPHFL